MKKKLFISAILLLLVGVINAQYRVEKITNRQTQIKEPPLNRGIYYTLPANGFEVSITVQTTTYKKGIYSQYASTFLGLMDFISENNTVSEIENVKIKNTVMADNSQVFHVRSFGKKGELPTLSYSEYGTLLGVNSAPEKIERTRHNHQEPKRPYVKKTKEAQTFSFAEINVEDNLDTIMREELVDEQVIEHTIVTSRTVEKTNEQKAKELATLIIDSKKQRAALISGYSEVNYAPETIRFMYEQMLATENEYLRCFTGVSYKNTHTYKVFVNIEDTVSKYSLGTYTSKDEPLYLTVEKATSPALQIETFEKEFIDQTENTGFFVRLPQVVKATIKSDKKIFKETQLYVSQWGHIYSLPVGDFSIKLNPKTGALKTLSKR
ncbi:MAG: DUF4831 family protein [Bacteroidales bacterium]|jgi:hypothetical protein|nr:DUF4831 family protein [Bacteroidales bacterium]